MMKRIILASASPRRTALLDMIGLKHEVVTSYVDEDIFTDDSDPEGTVLRTAEAKAAAVAEKSCDAVVIGADTAVYIDGRLLGKPGNTAEAREMLGLLRGRTHTVYTGVVIIEKTGNKTISYDFCDKTDVTMRNFSDKELEAYIGTGEPFDKAGAYAAQGLGSVFVERIDGDFYTVVGLPVTRLCVALAQLGADVCGGWADLRH